MIADELIRIAEYMSSRRAKASELEFIARIKADGSETIEITDEENKTLQQSTFNDVYKLHRLSISEDTWVASGFHSYVVRKKEVN